MEDGELLPKSEILEVRRAAFFKAEKSQQRNDEIFAAILALASGKIEKDVPDE